MQDKGSLHRDKLCDIHQKTLCINNNGAQKKNGQPKIAEGKF